LSYTGTIYRASDLLRLRRQSFTGLSSHTACAMRRGRLPYRESAVTRAHQPRSAIPRLTRRFTGEPLAAD